MSASAVHLTPEEFSSAAGKYVESAASGTTYVVESHGKEAGIVSMDTVRRLRQIDELVDDIRLMSVAAVRMATDTGERTSLDELAAMVGIDLAELEDED